MTPRPSSSYMPPFKALIALTMMAAVASCHRSASPATERVRQTPASSSAGYPGISVDKTHADSAASVSFFVAGTPKENWNDVNGAVQHTVFRFLGSNYTEGWIRARSVARGLILEAALLPIGSDSTRVMIFAQRYAGNSGRPGVTLLGGDNWPWIFTGEPGVARLEEEAIRVREGIDRLRRKEALRRSGLPAGVASQPVALIVEPVSQDSLVRVLSDGKLGYCRANSVRRDNHLDSLLIVDVQNRPEWCPIPAYMSLTEGNTLILVDPRTIAIGDTISACTRFGFPRRYQLIAEAVYSDPSRCPDGFHAKPLEPNMEIVRRVK